MAKDSLLRSHDHPAMSKTPTENAKLPRGIWINGCFQNGFQTLPLAPQLPWTLSPFNLEGSSKDWYSKSCFCRSEGPSTCQGGADMVRKLSFLNWEWSGQERSSVCISPGWKILAKNWNHFKKRGIKHGTMTIETTDATKVDAKHMQTSSYLYLLHETYTGGSLRKNAEELKNDHFIMERIYSSCQTRMALDAAFKLHCCRSVHGLLHWPETSPESQLQAGEAIVT